MQTVTDRERIFEINPGDFINRWFLSPIRTELYNSPAAPLGGSADNEWLRKGFAIHVYPCRRHFLSTEADTIERRRMEEAKELLASGRELYTPFGNRRVDRSGFYHVPTRLFSAAETTIDAPEGGAFSLRLTTSGGARLWIDDEPVVCAASYTRNEPKAVDFDVVLTAGRHRLRLFLDDLAERDTLYGFSLRVLSGSLSVVIPLADHQQEGASAVAAVERALSEAYLTDTAYTSGAVTLRFRNPLSRPLSAKVATYAGFVDGQPSMEQSVLIGTGEDEHHLLNVSTLPIGFTYFQVTIEVGGLEIKRVFNGDIAPAERLPGSTEGRALDLAGRRNKALQLCAAEGGAIPQTALAAAHLGLPTAGREGYSISEIIDRHLLGVRERRDCSDFYLTGLFWFLYDPRLSEGLRSEQRWSLEEAILGYRYWIDEPGSDAMWFFSENHALLFHTCELLAGQRFGDKHFSCAGISGAEHKRRATKRLHDWFKRFFREGLGEWNSPAYIPIDMLGLVTIQHWAEDGELRKLAGEALDELSRQIGRHSIDGVVASTHGRAYDKELFGRSTQPTNALAWVAWGRGSCPPVSLCLVPLALSRYEPPEEETPASVRIEWGGPGGSVRIERQQASRYALSAAVNYRVGQSGYQEHVCHLATRSGVHVWVNHPGEDDPSGIGRPSYWAGNGVLPDVVSSKETLFARFDLAGAPEALQFSHAFFPTFAFEQWRRIGAWWLGWTGGIGVALWAGPGESYLVEIGPPAYREVRQHGNKNYWILTATDAFAEFESFSEAFGAAEVRVTDGLLECRDPRYGKLAVSLRSGSSSDSNL